VTSNNLYWDGTNANTANGGQRVKMYAPSSWSNGSSYSHLDYSTFSGTLNSLMVYAIGSGSSQHNPGTVTLGILEDMGWVIAGTPVDPPTAPTGISATDGDFTDKVTISWNESNGAIYYKVYRNTSESHSGETELVGDHPTGSYDDTDVLSDQIYYYWVKACNSGGCSDYSSAEPGYALDILEPPTGIYATDGAFEDRVQISWIPSDEAAYYKIYRNSSNLTAGATGLDGEPAFSPYNDFDIISGVDYYYWVQACNIVGCSDFSPSDSGYAAIDVSQPLPPNDVLASDGEFMDKVQINWIATEGAEYYKVYRNSTDSIDGALILTDYHLSITFDDFSAELNLNYYYGVKACNSEGCSNVSDFDIGWREANNVYLPLIIR
jgi:fibronectin type 3 domain-containing protein